MVCNPRQKIKETKINWINNEGIVVSRFEQPDFLKELEGLNFKFIDRKRQNEKASLSFYTFERIWWQI